MPLDGNGQYTPPSPQFPAVPGTIIYSDDFNTIILDIAEALSMALYNDGQQVWTGNEDADGHALENLSQLTADGSGCTLTGSFEFTTSPTAPTPAPGDDSTKVCTTEFANLLAFAASLPAQGGNAGKVVKTNGSAASWAFASIPRSVRSSNTILGLADSGYYIGVTGTFTQTLENAATLGNYWSVIYANEGTGDITITIGGVTFIMYPGESRLLMCDGAATSSKVLTAFSKTITVTGDFTVPPGYLSIDPDCLGGGGGGGRPTTASNAGGGGGGGGGRSGRMPITGLTPGTTITCTIGAGGAGASANGTSGSNGGSSSFGTYVVATGGIGGTGLTPPGGAGGSTGAAHSSTTASGLAGGAGGDGAGGVASPAEFGGGGGGGGVTTGSGAGSLVGGPGGGSGGDQTGAGGPGGAPKTYTTGGGGAGGAAGGATGTAGTAGTAGANNFAGSGGGGGGGGTNTGGAGADGGIPAAGGGGGGYGPVTTGNGGAGARGQITITGTV